ncbi:MAG TPA: helix-turn-helix domain-containing protein [Bradyrhizobium sp.]|jgi:DNA-binding HxlR family transcriptional regulator|nr:helix-turn-helix domain-containing protein [Bradyrhizobium sp.]
MPQPAKSNHVRGSRTSRPIVTLLDLLGRRWSLRILWELRNEALTSRALRAACDEASPTVLQSRLDELRDADFIALGDGGYALTPLGRELFNTLMPLHGFAERWRKR